MIYDLNYDVFIAFLALLGALFVIDLLLSRKSQTSKGSSPFMCGEVMDHESMDFATDFCDAIAKTLRTDVLERLHTGRLSDYLMLILTGTLIAMVMLI